MPKIKTTALSLIFSSLLVLGLGLWGASLPAQAATQTVPQTVQVTAVIHLPVPTTPAVITSPVNNTTVSTTPMVARGTCGAGLLVRVYDNGQLSGSVACSDNGDFVINITLGIGNNQLTALNYNAEERAGPASAAVNVYAAAPSVAASPAGKTVAHSTQSQPLFENTFLQPVASVFGIDRVVAPHTNHWIAIFLNCLFLVLILLIIVLGRRRKEEEDEPKNTTI